MRAAPASRSPSSTLRGETRSSAASAACLWVWRRSPRRAGAPEGDAVAQFDGGRNLQPDANRRVARVEGRAGAVDLVLNGRGLLFGQVVAVLLVVIVLVVVLVVAARRRTAEIRAHEARAHEGSRCRRSARLRVCRSAGHAARL